MPFTVCDTEEGPLELPFLPMSSSVSSHGVVELLFVGGMDEAAISYVGQYAPRQDGDLLGSLKK